MVWTQERAQGQKPALELEWAQERAQDCAQKQAQMRVQ